MKAQEVIKRIVGNINSAGETYYDNESLENIMFVKEIFTPIIIQLVKNAKEINDPRHSVKEVSKESIKVLNAINELISEVTNENR